MINLSHINKSYGNIQVLEDVNLNINKGEIYGLIGKNGAGKTTIFKIILGLTNFNSGELTICEEKTMSGLQKSRKRIGFFIGKNFYDYLSARENLNYYRRLKGIKDKNEVDRVLKLVDLYDSKAEYRSFSMGMKQRLGIANALLGNPEILILDEPTNGLDPQGIADIRNLIIRLNKEFNMTIIVSSHILGELEHTATKFGIVHQGQILKEITLDDLKSKKNTIQIQVEDLEAARDALQKSNITVLKEYAADKSLEDYYFELVGEKEYD